MLASMAALGSDGDKYQVAVWLIPAGTQQRQISEVISSLASDFSSPVFPPHATLCAGGLEKTNLDEKLRALFNEVDKFADNQKELSLATYEIDHIDHRDKKDNWPHFLLLRLEKDGEERTLSFLTEDRTRLLLAVCGEQTPTNPKKPVPMHISLMYSDGPDYQSAKNKAEKDHRPNLPEQIVFDSIQVVAPRSGDWHDILVKKGPEAKWDILYSRKLTLTGPPLRMVLAGGQTGVDQAAWRAARLNRILIGGWCPPRRYSGRGVSVPAEFPCEESRDDASATHTAVARSQRTEWNVRDSDATLVLLPPRSQDKEKWRTIMPDHVCIDQKQWEKIKKILDSDEDKNLIDAGTKLTIDFAAGKKPFLICNPEDLDEVGSVVQWIKENGVKTLNVGGPAEATVANVGVMAENFLLKVFAQLRH
jgi:hypothetical protein